MVTSVISIDGTLTASEKKNVITPWFRSKLKLSNSGVVSSTNTSLALRASLSSIAAMLLPAMSVIKLVVILA